MPSPEAAIPGYDPGAAAYRLGSVLRNDGRFAGWYRRCTTRHEVAGYRVVEIALPARRGRCEEIPVRVLRAVANIAGQCGCSTLTVEPGPRLVLPRVAHPVLLTVWRALAHEGLDAG